MRIHRYNGKGGHHFVMWVVKFKAYLASQSLVLVLSTMFKASLPDEEDTVLNETDVDDKKKQKALDMNTKGTGALIMALETPEMMNVGTTM